LCMRIVRRPPLAMASRALTTRLTITCSNWRDRLAPCQVQEYFE
jgi:hypothetical protein